MPSTRLLIEVQDTFVPSGGVDGYVLAAKEPPPMDLPDEALVALRGDPLQAPAWRERGNAVWIAEGGLEAAARLRDAHPRLTVVPRVDAHRTSVTFDCGDPYPGEGFRVYVPDMAAIGGYRVGDRDQDLTAWLAEAAAAGFATVWLTAPEAERSGSGLDLDVLERARRSWSGPLWLSGGATQPRHLANLVREGGAEAVVVDARLVATHGSEALLRALGRVESQPAPVAAADAPTQAA